jgi:di/tricarboxylate transporter
VSAQQLLILAVLAIMVALFLWGRWRHDMVAVAALLACVLSGLVPAADAFRGFAHPAVVTVACVLVLSQGLQNSGAIDGLTRVVLPAKAGPTLTIAVLAALGALLSAFMNNVGALALLMPVAMQVSARLGLPPGRALMPLAFASILGGMTTLIGTPPNLIVSGFRAQTGAPTFAMFDFSPVGVAVAAVGLAFVVLAGWRLVPARRQAAAEKFDTGAYLTEVRVPEGSKADGMTLRDIEADLDKAGAQVVGLVRNKVRLIAPSPGRVLHGGDILAIEAEAEALAEALSRLGLQLEEAQAEKSDEDREKQPAATAKARPDEQQEEKAPPSDEIVLVEVAVLPNSPVTGRSAADMLLRSRYGINLLAVSREGHRLTTRLRLMRLAAGDVLLMQGPPEAVNEFAVDWRCVPLAERALRIPDKAKAAAASVIMAAAVAGAAFGLLPAAIAFAAGVLASMVVRTVPPRAAYEAIDWPVIVLLGALLPVAGAMASTGAADLIARVLLDMVAQGHPIIALALVLIVTMTLSDVMNNAATAAVMCPIAIGTANALNVNADPFLMAVAIGASCAFLTPIGHQNNTLILGPGGFRFGDYWRLGLPLEILVVAVSLPMLLLVWPL